MEYVITSNQRAGKVETYSAIQDSAHSRTLKKLWPALTCCRFLSLIVFIANEDSIAAFQRRAKLHSGHHQGTVFGAIDMDLLLEDALREIAFEIYDDQKIQESQRVNERNGMPSLTDQSRRLDLTHRVSLWSM